MWICKTKLECTYKVKNEVQYRTNMQILIIIFCTLFVFFIRTLHFIIKLWTVFNALNELWLSKVRGELRELLTLVAQCDKMLEISWHWKTVYLFLNLTSNRNTHTNPSIANIFIQITPRLSTVRRGEVTLEVGSWPGQVCDRHLKANHINSPITYFIDKFPLVFSAALINSKRTKSSYALG